MGISDIGECDALCVVQTHQIGQFESRGVRKLMTIGFFKRNPPQALPQFSKVNDGRGISGHLKNFFSGDSK